MDANVTISVGAIVGFVGFLLQIGLTVGAIAFSHGALNQRVRNLEEKADKQDTLSTSVTRLETEMESVGREIKGLRADLRAVRSELRNELLLRQPAPAPTPQHRVRPYDFPEARQWVSDGEEP